MSGRLTFYSTSGASPQRNAHTSRGQTQSYGGSSPRIIVLDPWPLIGRSHQLWICTNGDARAEQVAGSVRCEVLAQRPPLKGGVRKCLNAVKWSQDSVRERSDGILARLRRVSIGRDSRASPLVYLSDENKSLKGPAALNFDEKDRAGPCEECFGRQSQTSNAASQSRCHRT